MATARRPERLVKYWLLPAGKSAPPASLADKSLPKATEFESWLASDDAQQTIKKGRDLWRRAYDEINFAWPSLKEATPATVVGKLKSWVAPKDFPKGERFTLHGTSLRRCSLADFLNVHRDYWGPDGAFSEEELAALRTARVEPYDAEGFGADKALEVAGYIRKITVDRSGQLYHLLHVPDDDPQVQLRPEERDRLKRLIASRLKARLSKFFQLAFLGTRAPNSLVRALASVPFTEPLTEGPTTSPLDVRWSDFSGVRALDGHLPMGLLASHVLIARRARLPRLAVDGTLGVSHSLLGAPLRIGHLTVNGDLLVEDCVVGNESSFASLRVDNGGVFFQRTNFGSGARFCRMKAQGIAVFDEARFGVATNFDHASFGDHACFKNVEFGQASFHYAEFRGLAQFSGARLGESAEFSGAEFHRGAWFQNVCFEGHVNFANEGHRAIFRKEADFSVEDRALRAGIVGGYSIESADFEGCEFHDWVDFSNRTFAGRVSFNDAKFYGEPLFHGATLHQGVSFIGAEFDRALKSYGSVSRDPEDRDAADKLYGGLEQAFRTLKLAMEQQRARREEANFHRLELLARRRRPTRRLVGGVQEVTFTEKIISHLYERSSLFGERILWPLLWLLAVWVSAFAAYGLVAGNINVTAPIDWQLVKELFVFAGERTLVPVLSHEPGYYVWWDAALSAHPLMTFAIGVLHRTAAIGLLFVFALALRRRFEME